MRPRVGVVRVHPFYGPSGRLLSGRGAGLSGLLSMAAYLAFWAAALVIARRELDRRWPVRPPSGEDADPGLMVLRERFARGEIDESQYRAMVGVISEAPGSTP